jgi:hypothetical protein
MFSVSRYCLAGFFEFQARNKTISIPERSTIARRPRTWHPPLSSDGLVSAASFRKTTASRKATIHENRKGRQALAKLITCELIQYVKLIDTNTEDIERFIFFTFKLILSAQVTTKALREN